MLIVIMNNKIITLTKQKGVRTMRSNLIKTAILIFFFLGITLTSVYAGSLTPKDSTNHKNQENANVGKCKESTSCKDMDKTMKMDSKKVNKENVNKVINLKAIDKNKDGKVYQCPMDFDVLSDKPGKDPKCGMELKEVTLAQAKKNLTDHGFQVK